MNAAESSRVTAVPPVDRTSKPAGTQIKTAEVLLRDSPTPEQPVEQLEIEEPHATTDINQYPTGSKLWLSMISMTLCAFLRGLDLTIVAVVVPSITDEFHTVSDIGWYSAAYGMTVAATGFFFGKIYSLFDTKRVFLSSIVLFEIGSIICTLARTSMVFIIGRAVMGLGAACQAGGFMTMLTQNFPLEKRGQVSAVINFVQTAAMVSSAPIGGLLITKFTWRACFGINIPLQVVAFGFSLYSMTENGQLEKGLSLKEKLKKLDLAGTLMVIPAITCLLLGLQWGGLQYSWSNPRIIALLVSAIGLFAVFFYLQYRLGDAAVLPPNIVKNRNVWAGMWFMACCDGTLAVIEYFMSIYFQGVREYPAWKAGLLSTPMIIGLALACLIFGWGIGKVGYYNPFLYITTILAPIAAGLLSTLDLDVNVAKASALLGLLGFALGFGMNVPFLAISAVLPPNEVSIAGSILGFGAGLGGSLFISTSSTLFRNRLRDEIQNYAPGANITNLDTAGLTDLRKGLGSERLKNVLMGYNKAIDQTLYMPLALTVLTIIGSAVIEIRSVKRKQS